MTALHMRMSPLRAAWKNRISRSEVIGAASPITWLTVMEKLEMIPVKADFNQAKPGDTVSVFSFEDEQTMDFILAPPFSGKRSEDYLSIMSPLGSLLLGKHEGEVINVRLMGYQNRFLLLKVKKLTGE